jgi:CheY-like chemotaxis protein
MMCAREKTIGRSAVPGIMVSQTMKPDSIAPRALVIEDNPDVVETVAEMLETMGHTWEGAENVEDAVLKAQGGSFDYILCDLELPRSYGRLPNLSHGLGLIVMTAHSATADSWRKRGGAEPATSCQNRFRRPDTPCRRPSALRFGGDGFRVSLRRVFRGSPANHYKRRGYELV